jgi:hypothetical protein
LLLPVELQVAQIGGACGAGVPMETFTEQALDFAALNPDLPAFLSGYTDGWLGYFTWFVPLVIDIPTKQ